MPWSQETRLAAYQPLRAVATGAAGGLKAARCVRFQAATQIRCRAQPIDIEPNETSCRINLKKPQ